MFHQLLVRSMAVVAGLGLVFPAHSLAWGRHGHVIVAKIAELNLSASARQAVYDILGHQSIATDGNANWADDIKPGHSLARLVGDRYPNNSRWHFVDIPFDAASYDEGRDCDNNDCIVEQLTRFREIMADSSNAGRDQREALLFVIHFLRRPPPAVALRRAEWRSGGGQQSSCCIIRWPP